MSINNITPTKIIPEHIINTIPVSKGFNYKKLCIMLFVTLFLVFLMLSAVISIVGTVFIYHVINDFPHTTSPTTSPTKLFYNISVNRTVYPTSIPSNSPTITPSQGPTFLPSLVPTFYPSIYPTSIPSNGPTYVPSNGPTYVPSNGPTFLPSLLPTFYPSVSPTSIPSNRPTITPSQGPTFLPSSTPSYAPGINPTPLLTNYINDSITISPTIFPTCKRSVVYIYTSHNTTLNKLDQFKIFIDVLTIICPICLCCVCIHIPLAFIPICLKLKIDKVDLFEDLITQKIKTIQNAWRRSRTHTRKKTKRKYKT